MKNIPNFKDYWHWYVFITLLIITISPIFMMDYLITLDGPNHIYNSATFNRIINGDAYTNSYLELNPQITPNYASFLILSLLLQIFSSTVAVKVFHLFFILAFTLSFAYWNRSKPDKPNLAYLIFPLVFSYLFYSGFYNFVLAIILMFWILNYFEKSNHHNFRKHFSLAFLLILLYFSHSIVFVFTGIALALFVTTHSAIKKVTLTKFILSLCYLIAAALPCVVLAILFMGSRESEIVYLEFSELLKNLFSSKSIIAKGFLAEIGKYFFTFSLVLLTVFVSFKRVSRKLQLSDYLLITALSILLLYFILPDSVGYASVFSVRIEYFFWIFLISWLARQEIKANLLKYGLGSFVIIFTTIQTNGHLAHWMPLNTDTKKVLAANDFINNESSVYPIFTSNTWDHYHISNILGVEKNLFILENTGARQDYFPLKYHEPYEKLLDSLPGLKIANTGQAIDYVIKIGKNPAETERDIIIYDAIRNAGELVYENDLVEVWKNNFSK